MKTKHKIKQSAPCKRLLNIEVSKEEVLLAWEEVFVQIQKEAAIPGFRKGNAPLDIIKANYKELAKKRVTERLISVSYSNVMKEEGFVPIDMPSIENVVFSESGALSFEANIEIRPQVALKNYKGINIKKRNADVSEQDVDNALDNLRSMRAEYKTVPAMSVREGDFVLCDLEWFIEGRSIDKSENSLLPVEKNTLTPDVFNGILGSAPGRKAVISINIGKDFHKPEYIGKAGILEVLIREVKEKHLPPMDDEFAKGLGAFLGLDDLRQKIKQQLAAEKQQAVELDMENQAVEWLLKNHSFSLPSSLVESEIGAMIDDMSQKLLSQGASEKEVNEQLLKDKDVITKRLSPRAESRVKSFFILQEIAEKENLHIEEEEVEHFIGGLAKSRQKEPVKFKKELEKEGRLNGLKWQLTEAKVMDFLLKNAKVEEEKTAKLEVKNDKVADISADGSGTDLKRREGV